ncbi:MAG: 16S rRNA (guanine(966)-N(2))-methyltransferase RsmD [Pseudomonadota bacterium]|nr:16S rRNA (guanine(966)-N(2))-methyltransferase RsmD [Pseudomonadota bacterium]
MRIIAGKHKGRRIELGKDTGDIRPTSDFAREAIFNILAHGKHGLNGHSFEGQRVLDLFCGTGAFGLEALSRGADYAMFVDQSREAIAIARQNAERLHEEQSADFLLADATKLPQARKPFSLIFLDPPYFKGLIEPTLKSLHAGGWIAKDALIIAEHDAKEKVEIPTSFSVIDERKYGRAVVKLIVIPA